MRHAGPSGRSSWPGVHVADTRVAGQRSRGFAERTKVVVAWDDGQEGVDESLALDVLPAVGAKPRETGHCLGPPGRTLPELLPELLPAVLSEAFKRSTSRRTPATTFRVHQSCHLPEAPGKSRSISGQHLGQGSGQLRRSSW